MFDLKRSTIHKAKRKCTSYTCIRVRACVLVWVSGAFLLLLLSLLDMVACPVVYYTQNTTWRWNEKNAIINVLVHQLQNNVERTAHQMLTQLYSIQTEVMPNQTFGHCFRHDLCDGSGNGDGIFLYFLVLFVVMSQIDWWYLARTHTHTHTPLNAKCVIK